MKCQFTKTSRGGYVPDSPPPTMYTVGQTDTPATRSRPNVAFRHVTYGGGVPDVHGQSACPRLFHPPGELHGVTLGIQQPDLDAHRYRQVPPQSPRRWRSYDQAHNTAGSSTTQHTRYLTTYQHALQRRAFDVLYTYRFNMIEVFDLLMVLCQRRSSDPATYRHQGIITVLNFPRSMTQRADNETRSPWLFRSCASSRTITTAPHDTSCGPQNTMA